MLTKNDVAYVRFPYLPTSIFRKALVLQATWYNKVVQGKIFSTTLYIHNSVEIFAWLVVYTRLIPGGVRNLLWQNQYNMFAWWFYNEKRSGELNMLVDTFLHVKMLTLMVTLILYALSENQ